MASLDTSALRGFQPIYLHFLDRELRESLGSAPPATALEGAIRALLLCTTAMLYCGLAPAWEGTTDSLAQFIGSLLTAGHLDTMSHHADVAEFLHSKKVQYTHDVSRYPMYFGAQQAVRQQLRTTRIKRSSATEALIEKLNSWTITQPGPLMDRYYVSLVDKNVKHVVRRGLESRSHEAITYAMFSSHLRAANLERNPLAVGHLRREISAEYLSHYIDEGGGDIATGIAGFDVFDASARFFPLHDAEFYRVILPRVGLGGLLVGADRETWDHFISIRGGYIHRQLATEIRILLAGCYAMVPSNLVARSGQRYRMHDILQSCLQSCRRGTPAALKADALLVNALAMVCDAVRFGSRNAEFSREASRIREQIMKRRERVLLVTATQVEIENAIKLSGQVLVREHLGDHTYYKLGEFGGCEVMAVKCSMGSGGPGGSQATVTDAIKDVEPSAVVLVGIAFGMNREKQAIGDVLISRQLQPYELERKGVKKGKPYNLQRGPRVDVPQRMVDRFESGMLDWIGPKIQPGLILSGEKLVDSPEFKQYLLNIAPEAIGGEMEGAGLYAAATKEKVDWIVVKAIADWAEAKNDVHQHDAADNAMRFVFHVLSHGGLAIGVK